MMQHKKTLLVALVVSATTAASAHGATLLTLGSDGTLQHIDTDTLDVTHSAEVQGATLLGIDVRPADGMVYALGDDQYLYTLDPTSGEATQGVMLDEMLPLNGPLVLDFNPAADRLRLMAADGTNFRVNVDTGEVAVDGTLGFAEGDEMPRVVTGAYTNSFDGTESTQLFNVDIGNGHLLLQDPPNDGVLQDVGMIAEGLENASLDILSDGMGGNTAYLLTGMTLHVVDLDSGSPDTLGDVEGLEGEVLDIAVMPEM